jgi:type II secretory pathway component PulJ
MFNKKLFNKHGFTLAEVMVAAGMLSVISLGLMQVMNNATKGSKKIAQDAEISEVVAVIRKQMRDQTSCNNTIGGRSFGDTGIDIRNTSNNVIFAADSEYGVGNSRFILKEVELTGYVDPNNPLVAGGRLLTNNGAAEGTVLDAAGAPIDFGKAVLDLTFIRVFATGTTNADDTKAQNVTYGGNTLRKQILVTVVYDGTVVNCLADEQAYLAESCQAMGGALEGTHCKNVSFSPSAGLAGADFARPAGVPGFTSPAEEPSLSVSGSAGITPAGGATNAAKGNLSLNSGAISQAGMNGLAGTSNLGVGGSVGVGQLSTGQAGDMSTSKSLVVGTINAGFAQPPLYLPQNAVNIARNDGQMRIKRSLSIGNGLAMAASGEDGDLKVKRAIAIGNGIAPGSSGTLRVNNSVAIGAGVVPSTADGDLQVKRAIGVGNGYTAQAVDGLVTAKRGLSVGSNANVGVAGEIRSTGAFTTRVFDGRISTTKRYLNNTQANAVPGTDFITREWVNWAISSTFGNNDQAASAIAGYLNTIGSTNDAYDSIRRAICSTIRVNGAAMPSNCQITNIGTITPTYTYSSNQLRIRQANPALDTTIQLKDCSRTSPSKCADVYSADDIDAVDDIRAGGKITATGDVKGARICIGSNCRTSFSTRNCPWRQNVVSIGRGGGIGCAGDAY